MGRPEADRLGRPGEARSQARRSIELHVEGRSLMGLHHRRHRFYGMTANRSVGVSSAWALVMAGFLFACSRGSYVHQDGPGPNRASGPPLPEDVEFSLVPEFDGACEKRASIDVNLGNAPEAFARAAHCQINGSEPTQ